MKKPVIHIGPRKIGLQYKPFIIAEIGINHGGDEEIALAMVDAAAKVGCECVKFQTHIVEEEMVRNSIIPANANETIWEIIRRCSLSKESEKRIKKYAEEKGMIFLSTPFSKKAADQLNELGVKAFKIGSGECNNYPLVEHIAQMKKPVILSTGMNNITSISKAVDILRKHNTPFALLHCTSMYPTPYNHVRLGALTQLQDEFSDAVVGLSDHTTTNYTSFGAIALGASILERHFTHDESIPGPDIPISMTPQSLKDLIEGANAIYQARGGEKTILAEEQPTIDFAYSSVVAITNISKGELLSKKNIWVKRPGTGEIRAEKYYDLLGRKSKEDIKKGTLLKWQFIQ